LKLDLKHMLKHITAMVVVISLIAILFSCKEQNSVNTPTHNYPGIKVKVIQSSGELYNDIEYLPLLGNLAKLDDESEIEILILSKKLERGELYAIDPIGMLRYISGQEEIKLIVAIPTNPEVQSIKSSDLVDLSVEHASIKRIIEQWYSSFSGLGQNKIITWENKTVAMDALNRELPK